MRVIHLKITPFFQVNVSIWITTITEMFSVSLFPMPKCNFNKVAKQLNWSHFSAWVICCIFSEHLFLRTPLEGCFCHSCFTKFFSNSIWTCISWKIIAPISLIVSIFSDHCWHFWCLFGGFFIMFGRRGSSDFNWLI